MMQRMLSQPGSYEGRAQLRREISDYLMRLVGESWMYELMHACQELQEEDLEASRQVAPPTEPAVAVAEGRPAEPMELAMPDEETFAAMRWATRLPHDAAVLGLIRSLPLAVVEEQIRLYRQQQREGAAAVAEQKILVSKTLTVQLRTLIAKRFDAYCQRNGISANLRLPWGAMRTFVVHHLDCSAWGGCFPTQHIRKWHGRWLAETSGGNTIAAQGPKSLLKSRARKPLHCRARAGGAGRPFQAPLVRQALYEWWSSTRELITPTIGKNWSRRAAVADGRKILRVSHGKFCA